MPEQRKSDFLASVLKAAAAGYGILFTTLPIESLKELPTSNSVVCFNPETGKITGIMEKHKYLFIAESGEIYGINDKLTQIDIEGVRQGMSFIIDLETQMSLSQTGNWEPLDNGKLFDSGEGQYHWYEKE